MRIKWHSPFSCHVTESERDIKVARWSWWQTYHHHWQCVWWNVRNSRSPASWMYWRTWWLEWHGGRCSRKKNHWVPCVLSGNIELHTTHGAHIRNTIYYLPLYAPLARLEGRAFVKSTLLIHCMPTNKQNIAQHYTEMNVNIVLMSSHTRSLLFVFICLISVVLHGTWFFCSVSVVGTFSYNACVFLVIYYPRHTQYYGPWISLLLDIKTIAAVS